MHPPTFPPSPLPTLSPSHLPTFPPPHLPTFSPPHLPPLSPFASKSFTDRNFFINFEAKFVTTEKYE